MYEILRPCAPLRPFVECYWFLQTVIRPPDRLEELIFTDARADIVFTFGAPYARIRADRPGTKEWMRTSNVDAQRRYPVRIYQQGHVHLIGVRFRPGGLSSFVRMPVHELTGHTVSLADAFGPSGVELEQRLYDSAGMPETQAELLDRFFLSRIAIPPEYHRVMHWVTAIESRGGLLAVSELSETAGLSVRSVDRLFRRVMGLPPKFFARTVRFQHVHALLMRHPTVRWDEIVVSRGYFDQSHFAKDVQSLTGVDPNAYRTYLARRRDTPPPNHVQFLQDK